MVVLHDETVQLQSTVATTFTTPLMAIPIEFATVLALRINVARASDLIVLGGVEVKYDDESSALIPFVVHRSQPDFTPPAIVLYYNTLTGLGFPWSEPATIPIPESKPAHSILGAVLFLREAIEKMTGRRLNVVNQEDTSAGIVLTTVQATPQLLDIPEIRQALQSGNSNDYATNEAFYISSSADRLLLVANTASGLAAAVPALLESVGYEVLGMGPNWIHVPTSYRNHLAFTMAGGDRPAYLLRNLWATSGQNYGVGTLNSGYQLVPPDEPVEYSYLRWLTGTRMLGASIPPYPGHTRQRFHVPVARYMKLHNRNEGFLALTKLGLNVDRPAPGPDTTGWLWINTDEAGEAVEKVYLSDGSRWVVQNPHQFGVNLDLSVPFVREIILEDLRRSPRNNLPSIPMA